MCCLRRNATEIEVLINMNQKMAFPRAGHGSMLLSPEGKQKVTCKDRRVISPEAMPRYLCS
jgi:hypothetical protein